jgi:hypothetical protein
MFLILLVILAVPAPAAPTPHVRSTDPRVLALFESGLTRSTTFRSLVLALDRSDVIVYIEPKQARQQLGGHLRHDVVSQGGYRYLRLAVETHGSTRRLVSLLAHELRHAIEVSEAPQARDAESAHAVPPPAADRGGRRPTSPRIWPRSTSSLRVGVNIGRKAWRAETSGPGLRGSQHPARTPGTNSATVQVCPACPAWRHALGVSRQSARRRPLTATFD